MIGAHRSKNRKTLYNMKMTAKSRYALRVLLDIAMAGEGKPRPIKEIAASQGISEKFISRIAVPLRRAGLIVTERGSRGGLRLAKFPSRITLLAIVEATDGPLAIVRCLARPGACIRHGRCAAENAWTKANEALADALEKITLSEIAAEQRKLARPTQTEPDYCI